MFLQDFARTLRISLCPTALLLLISGCAFFDSIPSSGVVSPSLPARPSTNTNEQGTSVPVEQFKPKEKATDVLIELTVDTSQMEKLIIKYGNNPESLNIEKIYTRADLKISEDRSDSQVTVRIRDAGSIIPLYVSSAIESFDQVRSDFSPAVLVTGTVE